jgi:hypothetical protein
MTAQGHRKCPCRGSILWFRVHSYEMQVVRDVANRTEHVGESRETKQCDP